MPSGERFNAPSDLDEKLVTTPVSAVRLIVLCAVAVGLALVPPKANCVKYSGDVTPKLASAAALLNTLG